MGHLPVGSLEPAELDLLLAARLDVRPSAQSLERLHARSGGNPFFALEIARAMIERGSLPETDDESRSRRACTIWCGSGWSACHQPAREATEIVAALSRPTLALVDAVTGSSDSAAAIEAAATAGILELRGRPRAVLTSAARLDHLRADPAGPAARPARAPGRDPRRSRGTRASSGAGGGSPRRRGRRGARRGRQAGPGSRSARVGRGPVGAGPPAHARGRRDARRDDAVSRRRKGASTPARSIAPGRCWRRSSPSRRPAGSGHRR